MNTPVSWGMPARIAPGADVASPRQREPSECARLRGQVGELRGKVEDLKERAAKAASWAETAQRLRSLVNADGVVPVTARLSRDDLEFLATARSEMLAFADLGLCLLDMHQPVDAGGISSDPASPVRRCGCCMRLWPCPTFRVFAEVFGEH